MIISAIASIVHVIQSELSLCSIGITVILVLTSYIPQWGWLGDIEAQNKTNASSMVQDPTKVDEIPSGICASNYGTNNMNDSQSQDIVEVKCI
jgi:hypothetical protein